MKIEVLETSAKKLIFELDGLDHTFCNALKDELRNNSNVTIVTYTISHPLTGRPKFIIETSSSENPMDAVEKAVADLKKKNNAFLKAFETLK